MLLREVEDLGVQIGKRTVDYLGMVNQETTSKHTTYLEAIRYMMNQVWWFIFPSEVIEERQRETISIKMSRTNHFQIHNSQFRFLARISHEYDITFYKQFVVGVIKGSINNLGVETSKVDLKMV